MYKRLIVYAYGETSENFIYNIIIGLYNITNVSQHSDDVISQWFNGELFGCNYCNQYNQYRRKYLISVQMLLINT